MPVKTPITYLSSKVVLEHLEPNLRFQLSRCSPSLKNTEKSIPLKLNFLAIGHGFITVNSTEYYLDEPNKFLLSIVRTGKKAIYVKCLDIQDPLASIPFGMKFQIEELKLYGSMTNQFESIKHCIDQQSYPLRFLKICIFDMPEDQDHQHFEHPVLRAAHSLEISDYASRRRIPLDHSISLLKNRYIFLDNLSPTLPILLIDNWMAEKRAIGSTLLIGYGNKAHVDDLRRGMRLHYNLSAEADGTLVHLLTDDTTIEIAEIQREGEYNGHRYIIKMEVMAMKP